MTKNIAVRTAKRAAARRSGIPWLVTAALFLIAAPAVRAEAGDAPPESAPAAEPAAPPAAPAPPAQDAQKAEATPRLDIYGFAMLDMGYQTGQNDPNWFDVLRPTKLPAF